MILVVYLLFVGHGIFHAVFLFSSFIFSPDRFAFFGRRGLNQAPDVRKVRTSVHNETIFDGKTTTKLRRSEGYGGDLGSKRAALEP